MSETTISAKVLQAAALALALVVPAAGCGGGEPPGDRPPNVLLIVVDTLRADHLGCYGHQRETTPAIDRLAADGVRFDRAYATAPWTIPSVASMLTGMYPSRHSATSFNRKLPDEIETLPETLRAQGYDTAAVISHIAIDTRHNFQQGFEVFLEDEAQGHDHLSTEGVTRQAIEQLDRMSAADAPFMLFVHYFDPHYNYKRHPEFGFAAEGAGRLGGDEPMRQLLRLVPDMTGEEASFLADLYDEEIRFTDEGIGRLLSRLHELGRDADTVVVLTADHGEEFLDHGSLGHTETLYEELIRVPLIVRAPGRTGAPGVVDSPVSLVSLTPTLLDLLGLTQDGSGFSAPSIAPLLTAAAAAEDEVVFSEVDFVPVREGRDVGEVHKKMIVDGRHKLIRDDPTGEYELYDLSTDPAELEDLADSEPETLARLVEELERLLALSREGAVEPQLRHVATEEVERLKSLGYVGD